MKYIKRLNIEMERLKKEDNHSISDILNTDRWEYHKQLVERAGKNLRELDKNNN